MRAVVLADTHGRDGGSTRLPQRAWDELRVGDVILQAVTRPPHHGFVARRRRD
jgi:hypothetical protein